MTGSGMTGEFMKQAGRMTTIIKVEKSCPIRGIFLVSGNIGTNVCMFFLTSDFLTAVIVPVSSYCIAFYILLLHLCLLLYGLMSLE